MRWTDDQGYQQVLNLMNFTKSYLRGGQITQDIDKYLVLRIIKSYLQDGQMTKDTDGYLVLQILLSPTYGADG